MALPLAKKMVIASTLALGSGYTGAVVYGAAHEEADLKFKRVLPGYSNSIAFFQELKKSYNKLFSIKAKDEMDSPLKSLEHLIKEREILLSSMSAMASTMEAKNLEKLKELQTKYTKELDDWRGKFLKEQEENYLRELSRQEELERQMSIFKAEQEIRFNKELDRLLDSERKTRISLQQEFAERIEEIETKSRELIKSYKETMKAESLSTVIESLEILSAVNLDRALIVRNLTELMARSEEPFVKSICESLIKTTEKANAQADKETLASELYRLSPIAAKYANFRGYNVWDIIPILSYFRNSITRLIGSATDQDDMEIQSLTEAELKRAQLLIESGDFDSALKIVNSIKGWPRVILKGWITDCRRMIELEQGLHALKSFFLANRIQISR